MTTEPDHIIAIGASAGGMEEINSFFDHTPLDGVMVRNPETSEFSSMPSHALATGIVDFILEPELMPDSYSYLNEGK